MPPGKHLVTSVVFPVNKGTEVLIRCEEGYSLVVGDATITCVKDAEYQFNREPQCQEGRILILS